MYYDVLGFEVIVFLIGGLEWIVTGRRYGDV